MGGLPVVYELSCQGNDFLKFYGSESLNMLLSILLSTQNIYLK